MEKRVFLAILLMFAVLAVYDYFLVPKLAPPNAPQTQTATPPASPQAGAADAAPAANPAAAAPSTPATAVKTLVADTAEHEIVVETDTVRAVFSSKGATLRSWQLKNFRDATNRPFDVVPSDLPKQLPHPFTIATDVPEMSTTLETALYQPSTTSLSLGSAAGTLSFEYRDASGLSARKTFFFQPEGQPYVVNVTASVDVNGTSHPVTVHFGPALGLGYKPDGSRAIDNQALFFRSEAAEAFSCWFFGRCADRLSASALEKEPTYEGSFRFAGVEEQYFLSVALPGQQKAKLEFQPLSLQVPGNPQSSRKFISYSIALPGESHLPFFLGPKDFDLLRKVDRPLVYAIDFGMFRPIVVPLLQALKVINRSVGNFGWSIIILTIVINVLIFPLRHRSMVSMRKMQAAQPEIKAIQDRYAKYKFTDPERQKMNPELMALYKAKGINPASGCVPMLLTFPILLAFYSMLSGAIELRGAPFFGWIVDLSLRDPLYITPVLMGVTMFLQQRMMPSPSTDPVQQKLFLFMPIFFTFTFLWAPAGMVIYWLVSNLMGILQQTVTLKMIGAPRPGPPKVKLAKPAGNSSPPKA